LIDDVVVDILKIEYDGFTRKRALQKVINRLTKKLSFATQALWEDGARDVAANPQGLSTGPEKPGFRGKAVNMLRFE
jgi:hypothetical protein